MLTLRLRAAVTSREKSRTTLWLKTPVRWSLLRVSISRRHGVAYDRLAENPSQVESVEEVDFTAARGGNKRE
jgi:hypothetical protein